MAPTFVDLEVSIDGSQVARARVDEDTAKRLLEQGEAFASGFRTSRQVKVVIGERTFEFAAPENALHSVVAQLRQIAAGSGLEIAPAKSLPEAPRG